MLMTILMKKCLINSFNLLFRWWEGVDVGVGVGEGGSGWTSVFLQFPLPPPAHTFNDNVTKQKRKYRGVNTMSEVAILTRSLCRLSMSRSSASKKAKKQKTAWAQFILFDHNDVNCFQHKAVHTFCSNSVQIKVFSLSFVDWIFSNQHERAETTWWYS